VGGGAEAGATHAGIILVPGTPRAWTPSGHGRWPRPRAAGLKPVGVFRDEPATCAAARRARAGGGAAARARAPRRGAGLRKASAARSGPPASRSAAATGCCSIRPAAAPADLRLDAVAAHPARAALSLPAASAPTMPARRSDRRLRPRCQLAAGERARASRTRQDPGAVRRAAPSRPETDQMKHDGRFGRFGGCFVPEILVPALEQLEAAFLEARRTRASRPSSTSCSPPMPGGRRR
jgi:hypothetical protein